MLALKVRGRVTYAAEGPMAVSILGGLLSCIFSNLFVLPTLADRYVCIPLMRLRGARRSTLPNETSFDRG